MSYTRFFGMILTSTIVMFGLMYLNTYVLAHVFFSETRAWMALVMGATMAIIMLAFMLSMYSSKAVNIAIFVGSIAVFAVALWLVRSQVTVGDVSYMRAMIPHHSIAIMTSERANIEDARVRKLAGGIIAAQQKEISEMEYLISDIEEHGIQTAPAEKEALAPAGPLADALASPVIAALDPADLTAEEIDRVLGAGADCRFLRTPRSDPILATRGPEGVMKLSGELVELAQNGSSPDPSSGADMAADGVTMRVAPVAGAEADSGGIAADLLFQLERGLTVGYRGTWSCAS